MNQKLILNAGVFAAIASSSMAASAAPTLVLDLGSAIGVDSLLVGPVTYEVRWHEGSYDAVFGAGNSTTFTGNQASALTAANSLISFFNSLDVSSTNLGGGLACSHTSFDCDIVIPYSVGTDFNAYNLDWSQSSGRWELQPQNWPSQFDNNLVAMATFREQIAVPEPMSLALMSAGLFGLRLIRRKRA